MNGIAVIRTGGKQYKAIPGKKLKIEKLEAEVGAKIKFDTLLVAAGDKFEVGTPSLGERVEAEVVAQSRAKKVVGVKFKNKTRYKRTFGHRQYFTEVEIKAIK